MTYALSVPYRRLCRPLSIFVLWLGCLSIVSAQETHDIKLQLHTGDKLQIRHLETSVSRTTLPLLGQQDITTTTTYLFSVRILSKDTNHYTIYCNIDRIEMDVKSSSATSKKAIEATDELMNFAEIINKPITAVINPYFILVGSPKENSSGATTEAAQRIFTLVSDLLRPAYAGHPVALGQYWYDSATKGIKRHSKIIEATDKEAIIEGTLNVTERQKKFTAKGTGSFDSRINLEKGFLKSAHSNTQLEGKAKVLLFNLDFSSTQHTRTLISLSRE